MELVILYCILMLLDLVVYISCGYTACYIASIAYAIPAWYITLVLTSIVGAVSFATHMVYELNVELGAIPYTVWRCGCGVYHYSWIDYLKHYKYMPCNRLHIQHMD